MVTPLDEELVPEAFALIEEFGRDWTFTLPDSPPTYDANTGKIVDGDGTVFPNQIASPPLPVKNAYQEGSLIQEGDSVLFLAALNLPFTPVVGMQAELLGAKYNTVKVTELHSGELIAAFKVFVRK